MMDEVSKARVFGMRAEDPGSSASPRKIPIWDAQTARVISTILIFVAVGAFCFGAWKVLVAFLFAIFLAYLLEPLVSFAQRKSPLSAGSRGRAIAQVYIGLGILIAVLIIVAGPRLQSEGRRLINAIPTWIDQLSSGQIVSRIGIVRGWSHTTEQHLQEWIGGHRAQLLLWAEHAGNYAAQLVVNSVWLIIVPILSVFFLRDGGNFAESLIENFDRRRQRQFLSALLDDLDTMLARYIRAQLILAALTMIAFTVGLSLMGLPYSIALGVAGGVLEFIPVVGPLVAAAVILAVAFFTASHFIIAAIFLSVWRVVQDYVTSPRLMGSSVELHPLAALFAILAGAEVAGVIGVYLSIPIAATLRIFWRRWRTYSALAPSDPQPAVRRLTG
ncbi:MAG TPA: AI-2E family transporter [Terriglobales bacterium]|nr:AI-2E family transporter [Terriglobales bacterium]